MTIKTIACYQIDKKGKSKTGHDTFVSFNMR